MVREGRRMSPDEGVTRTGRTQGPSAGGADGPDADEEQTVRRLSNSPGQSKGTCGALGRRHGASWRQTKAGVRRMRIEATWSCRFCSMRVCMDRSLTSKSGEKLGKPERSGPEETGTDKKPLMGRASRADPTGPLPSAVLIVQRQTPERSFSYVDRRGVPRSGRFAERA